MRTQNPEYARRDLLFVHACEKCRRASRCTFRTSQEGPEEVCRQLIEGGTYNCESCLRRSNKDCTRYKLHGVCVFDCVFFIAK